MTGERPNRIWFGLRTAGVVGMLILLGVIIHSLYLFVKETNPQIIGYLAPQVAISSLETENGILSFRSRGNLKLDMGRPFVLVSDFAAPNSMSVVISGDSGMVKLHDMNGKPIKTLGQQTVSMLNVWSYYEGAWNPAIYPRQEGTDDILIFDWNTGILTLQDAEENVEEWAVQFEEFSGLASGTIHVARATDGFHSIALGSRFKHEVLFLDGMGTYLGSAPFVGESSVVCGNFVGDGDEEFLLVAPNGSFTLHDLEGCQLRKGYLPMPLEGPVIRWFALNGGEDCDSLLGVSPHVGLVRATLDGEAEVTQPANGGLGLLDWARAYESVHVGDDRTLVSCFYSTFLVDSEGQVIDFVNSFYDEIYACLPSQAGAADRVMILLSLDPNQTDFILGEVEFGK